MNTLSKKTRCCSNQLGSKAVRDQNVRTPTPIRAVCSVLRAQINFDNGRFDGNNPFKAR
jgi:hypothetical protein